MKKPRKVYIFFEYIPTKKNKAIEDIHGFERSRISEVFAKKFIEQFLKNENW